MPEARADAADVQAFEQLRLETLADDQLGRAAADVHHEALVLGGRQRVGDAEIDESRLLAARDDLDREAERLARLAQEGGRVLRDAQCIGADRAHGVARQAAQPLAELGQHLERPRLARAVEPLVGGEAGAELGLLAQRVERVDLAVHDAPDQEMEAVGSEVDRSECFVARHASGTVTPARATRKLSLSSECNLGTGCSCAA